MRLWHKGFQARRHTRAENHPVEGEWRDRPAHHLGASCCEHSRRPEQPLTGPGEPLRGPLQHSLPVPSRWAGRIRRSGPVDRGAPQVRQTSCTGGPRRKELLQALGIFQRATPDQLQKLTRPDNQHGKLTRDDLLDLEDHQLVSTEAALIRRPRRSGHPSQHPGELCPVHLSPFRLLSCRPAVHSVVKVELRSGPEGEVAAGGDCQGQARGRETGCAEF